MGAGALYGEDGEAELSHETSGGQPTPSRALPLPSPGQLLAVTSNWPSRHRGLSWPQFPG